MHNLAKNIPNMSVAAPRGGWGPQPPQKFGHESYFNGQLLSRKQVSQKIRVNPPLTKKGKFDITKWYYRSILAYLVFISISEYSWFPAL